MDTTAHAPIIAAGKNACSLHYSNIGIRIENDLLITDGKPINLFEDLPIEVHEIEAAMSKRLK